MTATIFDFEIAIKARDEASLALDKVIAKYEAFEKLTQAEKTEREKRPPPAARDRDETGAFKKEELDFTQKLLKGFDKVQGAFQKLADVSKDVIDTIKSSFDEASLDIEDNFQKITSQITGADDSVAMTERFTKVTLELANATGTASTEVASMFADLGRFSMFLDDDDIAKNTKTIAQLGQAYGVTSDQLASLLASARFLGVDVADSVETAAAASQKFKTPGLIENLPEILQQADAMFIQFGDRVTGDGKKITDALITQSAAVSRAWNIDMREAIQKVQGTMQQFTQELDAMDDVRLGLSTDFGSGTQALFQLGFGLEETQRLLRLGQEDALGFAEQIRAAAATKPYREQQRLLKLIGKEFEGQTKELLLRESVFQSALDTREQAETASGRALQSFDELTKSFRNSGKQAIAIFDNVIELGKTIIGSVFGKDAKIVFGDVAESLKGLNERLLALRESLVDPTGYFQTTVTPVLRKGTKVFLGLAGAITAVGGAFTSLGLVAVAGKAFSFLRGFIESSKTGSKVLGSFGKWIGNIGKAFKFLGKKILIPLAIFDSIMQGFKAAGEEKGNPIIRFAKGAAVAVDTLLMGIPGWLARKFFPETVTTFREGLAYLQFLLMDTFSIRNMKRVWASMVTTSEDALKAVRHLVVSYFDDIFHPWDTSVARMTQGSIILFQDMINAIDIPLTQLAASTTRAYLSVVSFVEKTISGAKVLGMDVLNWFAEKFNSFQVTALDTFDEVGTFLSQLWNNPQIAIEKFVSLGKDLLLGFALKGAKAFQMLLSPLLSLGGSFLKFIGLEGAGEALEKTGKGLETTIAGMEKSREDAAAKEKARINSVNDADQKALEQRKAARRDEHAKFVEEMHQSQQTRLNEMSAEEAHFEMLRKGVDDAKDKYIQSLDDEQNARFQQLEDIKKAEAQARREREEAERKEREKRKALAQGDVKDQKKSILAGNKDWIAAVEAANKAVADVRAAAIKSGESALSVDEAAAREALRQGNRLQEIRAALLKETKPKEEKSPSRPVPDRVMDMTKASDKSRRPVPGSVMGMEERVPDTSRRVPSSIMEMMEREPDADSSDKPVPGSVMGMEERGSSSKPMPETAKQMAAKEQTGSADQKEMIAKMDEWIRALQKNGAQEVIVKVDASRDLIVRDVKRRQQGQRDRVGFGS